jgi:hypothetical protein
MTIPKIDACEKLNAPEHLCSDVLVSALYVHNGKDNEDKLKRAEQIYKKIGDKKASYVMALLVLPQLMDEVMNTDKYKDFQTERNQRTIH